MQYLIHKKRIYVDVKDLMLELSRVPKDISKKETLEILNRELNKLVEKLYVWPPASYYRIIGIKLNPATQDF